MSAINGGPDPLEPRRRWPAFLLGMISFAVVDGDRSDRVRTKRLFSAAMWASIVTSTVSVFQLLAIDAPWAAAALTLPIWAAVASLAAMWYRPSTFPGVMHIVAAGTMGTTIAMIVFFGGVHETAGNTSWSVLAVVGAVAIFADRRAHFWLLVFVVGTVAAALVAVRLEPLYVLPNRGYFSVFNLIAVAVFIYLVLYYFVRQSARLYQQSERLLRNILPDEVVERLKQSDEMIADRCESASILFADIAEFTPMTATMEPEEVIDLLNEVFTSFDVMVVDRGLEKIKTIGDAYMVGSGVPVARDDHADAICDLALAMQDHLQSSTFSDRKLTMRIGIASGPVMAGIIGRQKFSYDLWGDTVNLASRMESSGIPGRIQVTSATREMVAGSFSIENRGSIEVKGKGAMETWFLVGRVEPR